MGGTIRYSIQSSGTLYFRIAPTTGEILVDNAALPTSTVSSFQVLASNSRAAASQATVEVTINCNGNDNGGAVFRFSQNDYSFSNIACSPSVEVGTVTVSIAFSCYA